MKTIDLLNPDEKVSPAARKMLKFLDERLWVLRAQNDEVMPDADRAVLLGEIRASKELRKFITTKPVVVPDQSMFED